MREECLWSGAQKTCLLETLVLHEPDALSCGCYDITSSKALMLNTLGIVSWQVQASAICLQTWFVQLEFPEFSFYDGEQKSKQVTGVTSKQIKNQHLGKKRCLTNSRMPFSWWSHADLRFLSQGWSSLACSLTAGLWEQLPLPNHLSTLPQKPARIFSQFLGPARNLSPEPVAGTEGTLWQISFHQTIYILP